MMYKHDFVCSMKAEGKILREKDNTVYVPFGSEYSILMKNLRSVKARVLVSIDGQDVLNKRALIIGPNETIDLERFLGTDMNSGNRFKFIQKTEKIQEHRGDRVDDGIVRIEFQYEKPAPRYDYPAKTMLLSNKTPDYGEASMDMYYPSSGTSPSIPKGILRGQPASYTTSNSISGQSFSRGIEGEAVMDSFMPMSDEGITVKGSESKQSFSNGHIGALESEKHVITLMLRGATDTGEQVRKPILVNTKLVCETCGTSNKSSMKFCGECGTALTI